jgi:signal transduction histidine kinase
VPCRDGRVCFLDFGFLPGADLTQVFERFWRGPGAGGRPGPGLGLSIVAAIAIRHRGRVSIEDASFTIELPAAL